MPIYLVGKLFRSISDVIVHWYAHGFRFFVKTTISFLRSLDRSFSVRVSLENIFNPLYQDRSPIGYALGFILRSFKVITGSAVYAVVIAFAAALYIIWAMIPLYISLKIIGIDVRNIF